MQIHQYLILELNYHCNCQNGNLFCCTTYFIPFPLDLYVNIKFFYFRKLLYILYDLQTLQFYIFTEKCLIFKKVEGLIHS